MITPLCQLAYHYGTDKCPQIKHAYTPFYYQLFKNKRRKVKKVLEMGIGGCKHDWTTTNVVYDPNLKRQYHRAASLYMWRDFFPNAQIYGADIAPETLVEDERIKTYLCDERKKEDVEQLIKHTGADIDMFIDDGSHRSADQIFLARTVLPLLDRKTLYIIEDARHDNLITSGLSGYNCEIPPLSGRRRRDTRLIIVKRLSHP